MHESFLKNIGPITKAQQRRLCGSKILIAGCGGIGGYIVEYMARIGVGNIICADSDRFETSNLNRQVLSDSKTLGLSKALRARERVKEINPQATVTAADARLDEKNLVELIKDRDLIFDAFDNVVSKKALFDACATAGKAFVYGAVFRLLCQCALVLPGQTLFDYLYPNEPPEFQGNVLSFVPAAAASMQSALGVQYLCGDAQNARTLFVFDMYAMRLDAVQF